MSLADDVRVARRFQRSIRIDSDSANSQALDGFICSISSSAVLLSMARHVRETGQGAFTWTGPYGSGKSSLVLALSAILSGSQRDREAAQRVLGRKLAAKLQEAFPPKSKGWCVLPIIGRRAPLCEIIGAALQSQGLGQPGRGGWRDDRVLEVLNQTAAANRNTQGGVLVVIDELGKILEGAAHHGHDIFLLQNIAELASRSKGRLIFIGILHQSFDEYAQRLAREARDEWAKIQGRFIDLIVNVGGDEQLDLLSRAIETNHRPVTFVKLATVVSEITRAGRPGASADLHEILSRCWPLHPVVASLLGPLSRRRFGQNQRSLFAFLNSAEPYGFHDFLVNAGTEDIYSPDMLWDYLRANLEPAILASSDGHRWSIGVDAIERCKVIGGSPLHIVLLKSIALIDLFRERSGLSATHRLLSCCAPPSSHKAHVGEALKQLSSWSFVIFRKHLDAYALYAGSDFDIGSAIADSLPDPKALDLGKLRSLASLQPILAKRHYHDTGAIRWFNLDLVPLSHLARNLTEIGQLEGAAGRFLLAIPNESESQHRAEKICAEAAVSAPQNVVIGISPSAWHVIDLARELVAMTTIHDHSPELRGDAVARREVIARLADVRTRLEQELARMVDQAVWYRNGHKPGRLRTAVLNHLASQLADERYPDAPRISNELINRDEPSSNAVKALKDLLRRMLDGEGLSRLGIQGYPAEGGLCDSILVPSGLYRPDEHGKWRILNPDPKNDPAHLCRLWDSALSTLRTHPHGTVSLSRIYDSWQQPPFGIKRGLMPLLAVSLFLAHRDFLALYRQGVFQPQMTELDIEVLVSDPSQIQFRHMEITGATKRILLGLATLVADPSATDGPRKPIDIARGLIATYDRLPPYTRRSARLSPRAQRLSAHFRHAADPNKLLFEDIPDLLDGTEGKANTDTNAVIQEVASVIQELKEAYPKTLRNLEDTLLQELEVNGRSPAAIAALQDRAKHMQQVSGDFRLNAFIARLSEYRSDPSHIEGLISLALNKRPDDWVDADIDQARLELAQLAQRFVHDEAFVRVSNRPDKRMRMSVIVPREGRPTAMQGDFDVKDTDRDDITALIGKVEVALEHADLRRKNVILAALAELSARYMQPTHIIIEQQKRRSAS